MTQGRSESRAGVSDDLREVLLTLSSGEFERFARDLELLRADGAESNTEAVIEAVQSRAAEVRVAAVNERSAA